MAKHTPGPWEVCPHDSTRVFRKNDHNDKNRLFIDPTTCSPIVGESEANARLIAAAPELLEACKEAVALITNHESGHCREFEEAQARLLAAIKAAEGE